MTTKTITTEIKFFTQVSCTNDLHVCRRHNALAIATYVQVHLLYSTIENIYTVFRKKAPTNYFFNISLNYV